jgi:hypothetical protein
MSFKKIISKKFIAGTISLFLSVLIWLPIFTVVFGVNPSRFSMIHNIIMFVTFYAIYSFLIPKNNKLFLGINCTQRTPIIELFLERP